MNTTHIEIINEAKRLCENPANHENFTKGLKLFNNLISDGDVDARLRFQAIVTLIEIDSSLGNDKVYQTRDKLTHLSGEKANKEIELLVLLTKSSKVSSHERLLCAVSLYNHGYFEYYYKLFCTLSQDSSVLVEYRIEAVRYLFFSNKEKHKKIGERVLLDIIKTHQYPSDFRYKTIISFESKCGLTTFLNMSKLNVENTAQLLTDLQKTFFWDLDNDVRYRILSGQHLIQLDYEKDLVINELLNISNNINVEYNIRADAADVVLRLGNQEQQGRAQHIIKQLGLSKAKNLTSIVKTVYSDNQNVHDHYVNESVNQFIKTLPKSDHTIKLYDNTHKEVVELLYTSDINKDDMKKAFKSLDRISVDTASFTDFKLTTAEIFVHVWNMIKKSSDVELLKQRLIDELIDMCATCSSGHAARLVNVLNGFGFTLKIDWGSQIKSNTAARLEARIKKIENEDERNTIIMGISKDTSTKEERAQFINFLLQESENIRKELYSEFVNGGHVDSITFDEHFQKALHELL